MQKLTDKEFKKFFDWLPLRTQMFYKGGLCSDEVLCEWYKKFLLSISPDYNHQKDIDYAPY